jgi:hypothetical protein
LILCLNKKFLEVTQYSTENFDEKKIALYCTTDFWKLFEIFEIRFEQSIEVLISYFKVALTHFVKIFELAHYSTEVMNMSIPRLVI